MGLMEFLRQWQRGRLAAGILVSILLHVALVVLAVGLGLPGSPLNVKRGEPLIVELPKADDSPPPGRGGIPASVPSPPPSARAAPARPSPPASKAVAAAASRPAEPARQPPPPAPRPQPEPPRQVASAPSVPVSEAAAPVAPPAAASQTLPAKPEPSEPAKSAPAEPVPQPQVASLPPAQPLGRRPPDTLSALRRGSGGAGGSGEGRAGVEGEPIPLDSKDPRYSDYLDRVRRAIKDKWGFPCVKNDLTHQCEYKTTQLIIEFGIAKDGTVPFVTVVRPSGYAIYDDYAVNAVKLAAPFPPIPDNFSKTGVPIHATFSYMVESSLANILR